MNKLKAIVAVDKNWGIGKNNKLLFSIPDDMKFFKAVTGNNIVIMGRKTYESIGNKPLSNRINVVITNKELKYHDNLFALNGKEFEKWLSNYNKNSDENKPESYIIGGESIYHKYINRCDELYITIVDKEYDADTHFPDPTKHGFKLRKVIKEGEYNGLNYKITLWSK